MTDISYLLNTIITVGGLGFINYFLLLKIGAIDHTNSIDQVREICFVLSVHDYIIFLIMTALLNNSNLLSTEWLNAIAVIGTIIVSSTLTLVFGNQISALILRAINRQRTRNGNDQITINSPWQELGDPKRPTQAYIYKFDHQPLGCGEIDMLSESKDDNYSITLQPFSDKKQESQPSFDRIMSSIQDPQFVTDNHVRIHVNFKQSFIIVTMV